MLSVSIIACGLMPDTTVDSTFCLSALHITGAAWEEDSEIQNLPPRGKILPLAFVTAALKPANLPSGVSGARVTQCNNGLPERGAGLTKGTVNKLGISGHEDGAKFVNNGMDFFTSVFSTEA